MRHLHTDSHFRLAIAALQDSGGYVDTLLGLARDQIMARQPLISPRRSRTRGHSAKSLGRKPNEFALMSCLLCKTPSQVGLFSRGTSGTLRTASMSQTHGIAEAQKPCIFGGKSARCLAPPSRK